MSNYSIRNVLFQIQKRFLQSSATLSSVPPSPTTLTSSSSATVEFLVNSCGLSSQSALSVSRNFQLSNKAGQNPYSVLQFLKSHHFSDTLIAQLIEKRPITLNSRVEGNLRPKFEYLMKIGLQDELLTHFVLSYTRILDYSLDHKIKPSYEFLRLLLESNEKIVQVIKRAPWLLTENLKLKLQPIVDFLMKEGVPARLVVKLLTSNPRSCIKKYERFVNAVNFVKNLGFEPSKPMFIHAVATVAQLSVSTWQKKIGVLNSKGFTEEETLKAFKRDPPFLRISEEKMRNSIDFYLNTIKMEPQKLFTNPGILRLSIEKRVRPRYNVLKVLESMGLVEGITKTVSYLQVSEKDFLKKYVDKHSNDVPGLLEIYLHTKEAGLDSA